MKKIIHNFEELIKDFKVNKLQNIYSFKDYRQPSSKRISYLFIYEILGYSKHKEVLEIIATFGKTKISFRKEKFMVLRVMDFPLTRI